MNEIPKKMLTEPLHMTRKRGRPKLRWIDGVVTDSRDILSAKNWMTTAHDRCIGLARPVTVTGLLRRNNNNNDCIYNTVIV